MFWNPRGIGKKETITSTASYLISPSSHSVLSSIAGWISESVEGNTYQHLLGFTITSRFHQTRQLDHQTYVIVNVFDLYSEIISRVSPVTATHFFKTYSKMDTINTMSAAVFERAILEARKEKTFWQKYKWMIIGGLAALPPQIALGWW